MDVTIVAFERHGDSESTPKYITDEMNKYKQGNWQCIIGDDYAFKIQYSDKAYIQLRRGKNKILIFQTVQTCKNN